MKRQKWIADICAYAFVFLFVYTASSKLLRLDVFEFQLTRFPWLSSVITLVAWGVPIVELLVAVALLTGRIRLKGFYAALILMSLFTIYLALMIASGKHLPCSCGGVISWMSWKQHLVFNLCFIGIAIMGLVYSSPKIQFYESKT